MTLFDLCSGTCITCGKCASSLPILEGFHAGGRPLTPRGGYGIAADIGTSTVVLALLDLSTGKTLARHSFLNPQRAFGPDVISRIDAANRGHLDELSCMIKSGVSHGVRSLLKVRDLSPADILDMTIVGNTVMTHLLLSFPCESLGVIPFQPTHTLEEAYDAAKLFDASGLRCALRVIPWIAGYVGGDVTAGLLHVLPEQKRRFLLIDLGTNGEMALYDDGALTVTATAAGPAFEQPIAAMGEGSGTMQGASGVISALAALIRDEMLDETGVLEDETIFTQKQIRDLQLAKSAIRAGLEILLETTGHSYEDLDALYLAGGIGQGMDTQDAVQIGLIPSQLEEKAQSAGNAALGGAAALLIDPQGSASDMEKLFAEAKEINLAAHPSFNDYFMEYMFF